MYSNLKLAAFGTATALLLLAGCTGGSLTDSNGSQEDVVVSERTIREVLDDHNSDWLKIDGVVGTGITRCDGALCIEVLTSPEKMQHVQSLIPESVEGYQVTFVEEGPIHAY